LKLEDIGITKQQCHNWQKLAALDEEALIGAKTRGVRMLPEVLPEPILRASFL
jgi:hypothetical protein